MAPKCNVGFEILHKIWLARAYRNFSALWNTLLEQTGVKRHSTWLGEKLSPGQLKTRSQLGTGNKAELFYQHPRLVISPLYCTAGFFRRTLTQDIPYERIHNPQHYSWGKNPFCSMFTSAVKQQPQGHQWCAICNSLLTGKRTNASRRLKQLLQKSLLIPIFLRGRNDFVEIVQVTSELFKAFCTKSTDAALRRLYF